MNKADIVGVRLDPYGDSLVVNGDKIIGLYLNHVLVILCDDVLSIVVLSTAYYHCTLFSKCECVVGIKTIYIYPCYIECDVLDVGNSISPKINQLVHGYHGCLIEISTRNLF